ncbi:MAG: NIPSNAP family protein [Dehalococcoidia bacterium]|nr:NIPSNAP family protein [Dehalococcoidia bacterium]
MTVAHLRTYTIKPGKMDSWAKFLLGEGGLVMAECGMKVESAWINRELNQFIWIRSYGDSTENIEKCETAFANHEWRKAAGEFLRAHVEHREIVLIESVGGSS